MKNVRIKFRKLYHKIEEGECATYSFIAFQRIPLEFKSINHGDKSEEVVSKYRCVLFIDLYICILKFKWFLHLKK